MSYDGMIEFAEKGQACLMNDGRSCWMAFPVHPVAAAGLGDDRMFVAFKQTAEALHNQVANRLSFAWAGAMRYPEGFDADVRFNAMGEAI